MVALQTLQDAQRLVYTVEEPEVQDLQVQQVAVFGKL